MPEFNLECPVCEEQFEMSIEITPGKEPSGGWGDRPETYDPGYGPEVNEGGEVPKACPECETVWTPEQIKDLEIEAEKQIDQLLDDWQPADDYSGPDTLDEDDR